MTGIRNIQNPQRSPRMAADTPSRGGFTLIELMVTMTLFLIIIAIATGAFVNALRTQRQVSSLISAQSNVSLALEQMARQIRTGYLFCHQPGSNAESGCDDPLNTNFPACSIDSATNVWTCPALDFWTSGGEIHYSLQNGAMMESVNGGAATPVTSNSVAVKYLRFRLFGQLEGDHWPPRVTVSLGIAPSSTDPAVSGDVFNLQTTVSSRQIDCITTAGGTSC